MAHQMSYCLSAKIRHQPQHLKKNPNTKPQTKHPNRFYFSSIYGYRVELTVEVTSQFVAAKHLCRFQPRPLIISSFLLSQKAVFTRVRHHTFTGSIVS